MSATITIDPRSQEVWEENLKILSQIQPHLAQRLEAWIAREGRAFRHVQSRAENGLWVEGLTAEPFFQSEAFPPLPWESVKQAEDCVLFIYGAGVAPWLHMLMRSLPPRLASIVVIEPSLPLLAYTLHTTWVYKILPVACRLAFVASDDETEMEEALRYGIMDMGTYLASNLALYSHPGEVIQARDAFATLQADIHMRLVVKLQQLGNSVEDTLLGVRQIALLSPWAALGPCLGSLRAAYSGRPFVWVASGPSLEKNFRLLSENRDRAVVICADTAAAKLLQNGIVPHIVVALERGLSVQAYLEKLYTRFPQETPQILLVAQAVCVPEVVGKWPGPVIVVGKAELSLDRWLVGEILGGGLLMSGLSVAHMGVWLASFLGASSLALIGQDLAFAPGRVSHASGTVSAEGARVEAEGEYRILKGTLNIPAALGGFVETHEMWRVFLKMMERYIPFLGCPVFDCTEGGALIRGTKVLPFRQWIDDHLEQCLPFKTSPAVLAEEAQLSPEARGARADLVAQKLGQGLGEVKDALDEVEGLVEQARRVGAPGISEGRRRRIAEELYAGLDAFNRRYPVMDFVGQGFAAINALKILRNRRLEDAVRANEWLSAFEDLFAAYRLSLSAFDRWLRYVACAVRETSLRWEEGFALKPLFRLPASEARDLNGLEDLLSIGPMQEAFALTAKGTNEAGDLPFVLLDNLLARADHKWWHFWDTCADWKAALALEKQGRFAEAALFMDRFEQAELKVFGLPGKDARAFYLDQARISTARDWVYEPNLDKAEAALNAAALADAVPISEDVQEQISEKIDLAKRRLQQYTVDAFSKNEGRVYFDYTPDYLLEDAKRMVEDIVRLAATASYNRDTLLHFSRPGKRPKHKRK